MIVRRWCCNIHGRQETATRIGDDPTPRCPVCSKSMFDATAPANDDPRRQKPPSGETRPL